MKESTSHLYIVIGAFQLSKSLSRIFIVYHEMLTTKSISFIIASFTLMGILMISSPFIYKGISVKNTDTPFIFQQVSAQTNAPITTNTNNSSSLGNTTTTTTNNHQQDAEKTILRQGIVT